MASGSGLGATASVETLRRLKEVETEWEGKLTAAREAGAQRVEAARAAAESIVAKVRQEVEREREATLTTARDAAQAEAERLVQEGEAKAREIDSGAARLSPTTRTKILAIVLSGFQGSDRAGK